MIHKDVIIIGAGGHARVIASILKASLITISGFYDDDPKLKNQSFSGIPVLGTLSELKSDKNTKAIIGIGDNALRKQIATSFDFKWINAIHPFSFIDPSVDIGLGTVICAGGIIQPGASIGNHVILNTKASVDHDCTVGDYSHIAVAHLGGGASISDGVFMALNSVVLPNIHVEEWSLVGAGAVVTKNVEPFQTVIGISPSISSTISNTFLQFVKSSCSFIMSKMTLV